MTIANDIISCRVPDLDYYLREGDSLDDIDEYGFTPLIESVLTRQMPIAQLLLDRGVAINKPDVTGRTALHWAVDNADLDMIRLLLQKGANPNAYTRSGLAVLVYPILRGQADIKHLLYQYHAKLDFALDFIYAKLLGHRFELSGDVDIVTAEVEFIELDYEGFILEFTIAVVKDSLRRFTSSYSTRHMRHLFPIIYATMDGFAVADELLQLQHHVAMTNQHHQRIQQLIQAPLLVLPAASQGHAICFVRYQQWWAKIDRGENSLKEGSVNIYHMERPQAITLNFILDFLYKKQSRRYFHKDINKILGLTPVLQLPIAAQIVGNCSWANVQAAVPVAHALQTLQSMEGFDAQPSLDLYMTWIEWDKDRALDECIQRFYAAQPPRTASFAAMLGAVLFQVCEENDPLHLTRAEKILAILSLPEYAYILQSYLDVYCVRRLTRKGNNLLKLLDNCGVNPNVGVNPIATGLDDKQ